MFCHAAISSSSFLRCSVIPKLHRLLFDARRRPLDSATDLSHGSSKRQRLANWSGGEGETMTREARTMSGIILITVPTIQYGGYFLLTSLMNKGSGYMENPLRQNFFRAGHAHAGVIVILSLVCQMLADAAALPSPVLWAVRIGVPLAAILISSGFFFSVLPPTATQASGALSLIYVGAVVLAIAVVSLGIGLLRTPQSS